MKLAIVLLAALACACGDDSSPGKMPDAGMGDAMPDGPAEEPTFTSYVIDLITNHTTDTEAPRPYAELESLPDPDTDNPDAYQSLF